MITTAHAGFAFFTPDRCPAKGSKMGAAFRVLLASTFRAMLGAMHSSSLPRKTNGPICRSLEEKVACLSNQIESTRLSTDRFEPSRAGYFPRRHCEPNRAEPSRAAICSARQRSCPRQPLLCAHALAQNPKAIFSADFNLHSPIYQNHCRKPVSACAWRRA